MAIYINPSLFFQFHYARYENEYFISGRLFLSIATPAALPFASVIKCFLLSQWLPSGRKIKKVESSYEGTMFQFSDNTQFYHRANMGTIGFYTGQLSLFTYIGSGANIEPDTGVISVPVPPSIDTFITGATIIAADALLIRPFTDDGIRTVFNLSSNSFESAEPIFTTSSRLKIQGIYTLTSNPDITAQVTQALLNANCVGKTLSSVQHFFNYNCVVGL